MFPDIAYYLYAIAPPADQYPLEDILDKFYVAIQDFYEDLNCTSDETCYLEFSASDMEDIQKLLRIVNKHVYNKEDGDYVELVIE